MEKVSMSDLLVAINNLTIQIGLLTSKIDKLDNQVNNKPSTNITFDNNKANINVPPVPSKTLYKYDPEVLEWIMQQPTLDDWSTKFLNGILASEYHTITEKQLKKVVEIAGKVGFHGDVVLS